MTSSTPAGGHRALAWEIPEPIYIVRVGGQFVDVNRAFLDLVGAQSLDVLERYPPERLWVDAEARQTRLAKAAAGDGSAEAECNIQRLDGGLRVVLDRCVAVPSSDGDERLLVGTLQDVTTLRARESELRRLAVRDPLTGSYNRRYLAELTPILEAQEERWGVVAIDLDHFKHYNDEHGHRAGDEILARTARFLMQQVRAEDVVIRVGGDEFVALLLGEDTTHTEEVAQRLERAAVDEAPAPFSIGWTLRQSGEPLADTIGRADEKLIHVKVTERSYPTRRYPARHSGPISRASVMIVDEDSSIRAAVKRFIEHDGHIVVDVADPETALAALKKHTIDLAFVDIGRDPHGAEILGQLRRQQPALPLVAMSSVEEVLDRAQVEFGPLYVLPKPFAMNRFATILRVVLR
ncbi:MAG: diguanylate cyclase [Gemmatimonadales bacterium]